MLAWMALNWQLPSPATLTPLRDMVCNLWTMRINLTAS